MSLLTSLFTGASGLSAHGDAIGVVGDNIANASTTGYKSSRAEFADVLGGAGPDGRPTGNGVRLAGTDVLFGQGSLQQTGRSLDMAISGNGFFQVAGSHGGIAGNWYTRNGQFSIDKKGVLVNGEGLHLQGYLIDSAGKVGTKAGDLTIGGESPPQVTSTAKMAVNLDSSAIPPAAWSAANPTGTSNYATSMTVYDSLGAAHRADVYFRATGSGGWEWHAMVDGGELTGGAAGTATEIATGTLAFNTQGALQTATTTSSSASFLNATANQAITFNFGDAIGAGGTGLAGTTQFQAASSVKSVSQDGYAAGTLQDVSVADDGTITGKFSNGQSRAIAQVALASFASDDGLHRAGGTLFAETVASGTALVAGAGTAGRGALSGGALEGSNVDLGHELVTLIAYQRAFQANSKVITISDEMLSDINNLKR